MTEVATPAVPAVETPAVPTPAIPATPAPAEDSVVLTKAQHDQLAKDAARGSSNQRKADLYDKMNPGGSHFRQPATPATPPSKEEMETRASEEDRKAERGLLALAADPAYREVLDADPTLREMFLKNPLAVLPMMASDAMDAEDAITLVKETLDGRKKPIVTPATPPATATPPAPPAGVINPPASQQANDDYEAAKKNPNTEHAIAGMVTAKMKQGS